jgi:modulator of FtsH protease
MAYTPHAWEGFFTAQATASAALAGLLFVGMSINLSAITASMRLSRRALEAFVLLVEILLLSTLVLIPDVPRVARGLGLLGVGVVAWALVGRGHLTALASGRGPDGAAAPRGSIPAQVLLGQTATLLMMVGAATFIAAAGGGLYWFAPGIVVAYVAALADTWVLLIEIQR